MKQQLYSSYLVRVWREDNGGEPTRGWHCEVESIQTGQRWQFDDLEAMIQFTKNEGERLLNFIEEPEDQES